METWTAILDALPPGLVELVGAAAGSFGAGLAARVTVARLVVRVTDLEAASELRDTEDGRPSSLSRARDARRAA